MVTATLSVLCGTGPHTGSIVTSDPKTHYKIVRHKSEATCGCQMSVCSYARGSGHTTATVMVPASHTSYLTPDTSSAQRI
jgi:hypothetical protein